MNLKNVLVNAGILTGAGVLSLLLCEGLARLALTPADYLSAEMVTDPVLGAVPSRSTWARGFDNWGFRNRKVPETADIVALGDSQTYGNTATMDDSWPYVLGRLTGRQVYNMGRGGYGPNQYLHLLETSALSLKPRTIVLGVSMTDDFENAFLITYGLEHWAYLRALPSEKVNFDIWEAPPALTWHQKIRSWLARHSVTYQLVVHGPLLGRLQGEIQIQNATRVSDVATMLSVPEKNISEVFLPIGILRRNDQEKTSVREGMRITLKLLEEMNERCHRHNAQFLVVIIPTKEMVFGEYLEHNRDIALSDVVDRLLANERLAREALFKFFDKANIRYVDTLPALRRAAGRKIYTRLARDMHPNKDGYRVIAEAVFEALTKNAAPE